MTKQEAEKKWWYRLIKIIFIILIFVSLLPIIAIYFDYKPEINNYDSSYSLKCNDGRQRGNFNGKELSYFPNISYDNSYYNKERFKTLDTMARLVCSYKETGDEFRKIYESKNYVVPSIQNYEIIRTKTLYYGSWWNVVSYSLLNIVIVIFVFSLLRAVFFYVAFAENFWINSLSFLRWLRNLNK
jgi:hypothetical protein